jgi:hypothetical protein
MDVMFGQSTTAYIQKLVSDPDYAWAKSMLMESRGAARIALELLNYFTPPMAQVAGGALALHDAMRGARVPHEISGFLGDAYLVFKPFGRPRMSEQMANILLSSVIAGSTPAAGAWKRSIGSLMLRKELRKVLVVMTDGGADDMAAAAGVLNVARTLGIEVYGVGINDTAITSLFPTGSRAVVIANGAVAPVLIDLVRRILVKAGK